MVINDGRQNTVLVIQEIRSLRDGLQGLHDRVAQEGTETRESVFNEAGGIKRDVRDAAAAVSTPPPHTHTHASRPTRLDTV